MGRYAPKNFGGVAGTLDATELTALDGVTAGTAKASRAAVLGANKNLDVLAVADLKLGAGAGTSVSATAAQLNRCAVTTAGTAEASKVAVLGAGKDIDTIDVTALKLGGTAVTATAAEINKVAGVTAGTAKASSAAVLGANKNLDVLAVADLKLGAGAGTSVTATAADLNKAAGAVGAFVQNVRVMATVEEVNAGKVLVATPAGKVARIVDAEVTAVGGAVGAVTTVDIKIGATVKITYARANLTEDTLLRLDSTGVTLLAAGASFTAGADGEDITAIKAGDDITTATHILFVLSFVFEDA